MIQQGGIGSILAWHIGLVKDGTPSTGMVHNHTDNSNADATQTNDCYAVAGNTGGGPLWGCENAGGKDIHIIGREKDGKDISPVHFSTKTLWHLLDRDRKFFKNAPDLFDGPLYFEESIKIRNLIPTYPFSAKSWINWDAEGSYQEHSHPAYGNRRGIWHVWTEFPMGGSDSPPGIPPDPPPPGQPGPPTPPGPPPPPHKPKRTSVPTGTSGGGGTPTDPVPPNPELGPTSGGGATSGYTATPLQHAGGNLKAKGVPHSTISSPSGGPAPNIKDYRTASQNKAFVEEWMSKIPITGILTPIYGYPQAWNQPVYTQQPRELGGNGKYLAGTGPGGWWMRQPESEITDVRDQNSTGTDPSWVSSGSASFFGFAPNIKQFFGYPNLSDGTIKKGWHTRFDSATGKLTFGLKEQAGTDTDLATFPANTSDPFTFASDLQADDDLIFKSGTSYKGTQSHNNSADRVYSWPDRSMTVAGIDDIVNQGWTRTGTNLAPTNAGDTVGITDSASAPTLRGVTDTDSGISVNGNVVRIWNGGTESAQIDNSHDLTMTNRLAWKDNTANKGIFAHANSADRTYTTPDETGQVKLKKDKVAFFHAGQSIPTGGHSASLAATGGGKAYVEFDIPDDFSSLTSLEVVFFADATDASVDIDLVTTYGAGGEARNTHTGSSTATTYNLTKDRITEVSITSLVASAAAQDYIGLEFENNDAATNCYVIAVKMVYTPTN